MTEPAPEHDYLLALAQAFQRGDEIAFGALYQYYKASLFRFCCKFLNDTAAAEDLTQETFLAAFQHHRELRSAENFRAYLFAIARRRCLNHLRQHSHDTPIDEPSPAGCSPDEDVERISDATEVQRAVAALPQDYREVILLREYEDLSYREIAGVLGCSEAAVKARLFKARRQLYEMLKEVFS